MGSRMGKRKAPPESDDQVDRDNSKAKKYGR